MSVQQQLGANWLLTANYIGNEGTHIWTIYQADPAVYIPGTMRIECLLYSRKYKQQKSIVSTESGYMAPHFHPLEQ